ncbi:MAG: Cro/CI family transcriptional regulator, partial [Steroidobacteraceae bacterium]
MLKSDVVRFLGSHGKVARLLGCTRQAVQMWPETVPEGPAYKLQALTRGRLKV